MQTASIVQEWFKKWEKGDFLNLPLAEDFVHHSPFGVTEGKENYLKLVQTNKDKFLGYQFVILDELYQGNKACIRYKAIQNDFELEVSEWHYVKANLITEIFAYYHIGEIQEDRKLD